MTEIIVLVSLAIIVFNFRRLPQVGQSLVKTLKAFRGGVKGEEDPRTVREVKEIKKGDSEK